MGNRIYFKGENARRREGAPAENKKGEQRGQTNLWWVQQACRPVVDITLRETQLRHRLEAEITTESFCRKYGAIVAWSIAVSQEAPGGPSTTTEGGRGHSVANVCSNFEPVKISVESSSHNNTLATLGSST